jgi:hypothetical protein
LVHTPSDEEVERAKLEPQGHYAHVGLTDIPTWPKTRQMLTYGRRTSPAEILVVMDAVSKDDIKATRPVH